MQGFVLFLFDRKLRCKFCQMHAYPKESHGFMSRDTQYMASFLIGKRRKDFQVDKEVYNRLREGQRGILEYAGSIFIDF